MTNEQARQADVLSVDIVLRGYIDAASSNCKDRIAFYNTLKAKGAEAAYSVFSNRVGINVSWLPQIIERIRQ